MKSAFLVALIVLACAVPASAQDRLELYADANMGSCSISEPVSPPIVMVHIFLTGPVSAVGVRFTAPLPPCWVGATWLGDALEPGFAQVGNSQSDWSIGWWLGSHCPTSHNPPIHIGAISYQISQMAEPCCEVTAGPSLGFQFVDCESTEHPLEPTKPIVVNPSEDCGCQSGILTAVENTSWGRVKALYR